MADITMCDNDKCKNRKNCYRATADVSDYQSWAIFETNNDGMCEYFVERVEHKRKAEKAIDW